MKSTAEAARNENKNTDLRTRLKRSLGFAAVQESSGENTIVRPLAGEFNANQMSLLNYAQRNARAAGIKGEHDKATNRFLWQSIRKLDDTYGMFVSGRRQKSAIAHGFSESNPGVIFHWNNNSHSQDTAEDLLYVMGATPVGEAEHFDRGDGIKRFTQEYASPTGLKFVDIRDEIGATYQDESANLFHLLHVYYPVEN